MPAKKKVVAKEPEKETVSEKSEGIPPKSKMVELEERIVSLEITVDAIRAYFKNLGIPMP